MRFGNQRFSAYLFGFIGALFIGSQLIGSQPALAGHFLDRALNPYVRGEFKEVDEMAMEVLGILTSSPNPNRLTDDQLKKLNELWDKGMDKMGKLPAGLDKELNKLLDTIQSEMGKDLHQLKQEFYSEFSKITGESELSETAMSKVDRVDSTIWPLVRSRILAGGADLRPAVELFEVSVATARLSFHMLIFSQAFAVVEYRAEAKAEIANDKRNFPQPKIALANYMMVLDLLGGGVEKTQILFPILPEFKYDNMRTKEGRLKTDTIKEFVMEFATPVGKRLQQAHGNALADSTVILEHTIRVAEQYRRMAFPFLENKEQSALLTQALMNTPGNGECFALSRGVIRSDILEGPPCRPKAFVQQLENYIAFNGKKLGYGLHQSLMGYLKAGTRVDQLPEIRKQVDAFIKASNFTKETQARWEDASRLIFEDPKLKQVLGQGLQMHVYLAQKLAKAGIVELLGLQASANYTVMGAVDILKGMKAKKLDKIERLERVTMDTSCRIYKDEDRDNAPKVVRTRKFVPINPEKGEWTSSRPSTAHFQRVLWHHEIEVGNAVTIQNNNHKRKVLAGLIKWTAMSQMMTNMVLAKGLMNELPRGDKPSDYGVSIEELEIDRLVAKATNYNLPTVEDKDKQIKVAWEPIMKENRKTYDKMLENFRESHQNLFNEKTPRSTLQSSFKTRYRQEMALAARMMRKWKDKLENFNPREEALRGGAALCRIFGLGPAWCTKELGAAVTLSLNNTVYPEMAKQWFEEQYPRGDYQHLSNFKYRNFINGKIADNELMPDQMLHVLGATHLHEKPIGPNAYYGGARPQDLARIGRWINFLGGGNGRGGGGYNNYMLLASNIVRLQKLYDHCKSLFDRRVKFLHQAVAMSEHLFPPLSVKVDWGWKKGTKIAYLEFDGSVSQFNKVMSAYITNNKEQIKKIQDIDDVGELENTRNVHPFLAKYIGHTGLMNQLLSYFPDQKKEICHIKDSLFWRDVVNAVVEAGFAIAMASLGPVGWLISGGIMCVLSIMRAVDAGNVASDYRQLTNGMATQVSFDQGLSNRDTVKAADFYAEQMKILAMVEVAAFAVSGIVKFGKNIGKNLAIIGRAPRALRRGITVYQRGMRSALGLGQLAKGESFFKWWSRMPIRVWRGLWGKLTAREFANLVRPFRRWGLIEKWSHMTLAARWNTPVGWLQKVRLGWMSKPVQFLGWLKDTLLEFPFSILTRNRFGWGRGVVANGILAYFIYGGGKAITNAVIDNIYTYPNEVMWDRIRSNPAEYGDLWQMVLEGELTRDEMIAIVEADDDLNQRFRAETGVQLATLLDAEDGNFEKVDQATKKEILKRLKTLQAKVKTDLAAAQANPEREGLFSDALELVRLKNKRVATDRGFDSEVWGLQKMQRRVDHLIWQIENGQRFKKAH